MVQYYLVWIAYFWVSFNQNKTNINSVSSFQGLFNLISLRFVIMFNGWLANKLSKSSNKKILLLIVVSGLHQQILQNKTNVLLFYFVNSN